MKLLNAQTHLQRKEARKIKSELRNIVSGHSAFQHAMVDLSKLMNNGGLNSEFMLVFGEPGTGKTSYCKTVKEIIIEENKSLPTPSAVPVILIESPVSPSAGGLAFQLLEAIGDPVNKKKERLEAFMIKVVNYLQRLGVKLIIIDEAHNYAPSCSGNQAKTSLNFLRTLSNVSHLPILIVGTQEAKDFYLSQKEIKSRTTFRVKFSNIPYGKTDERKTEFAVLVEKYATCINQLGTNLTFFTTNNEGEKALKNQSLLDKIYVATAGNLRSLRNLFYQLIDLVVEKPSTGAITDNTFIHCWLPSMNTSLHFNPFDSNKTKDIEQFIAKLGG